jgi:hypothetical protein
MLRVADRVADCVWSIVPQPTEWQRIGDQIDAAMIFVRRRSCSFLLKNFRFRQRVTLDLSAHHGRSPPRHPRLERYARLACHLHQLFQPSLDHKKRQPNQKNRKSK